MSKYLKILRESEKSQFPFIFVLIDLLQDKTISGLAKAVGVSRQSIYGWKIGATPSSTNLIAAANYLGVPVEAITSPKGLCHYIDKFKAKDKKIQEDIDQIKLLICL